MQQPHFGRRLRQLRTERGLSQSALAGDGMSTGYLSRLESGARRPTKRAVDYLADRLGVEPGMFEEPSKKSFLQVLTIAASADGERHSEELEELSGLLDESGAEDPVLRWHGIWLVAQRRLQQGRHEEAGRSLEEAVRIADDLDIAELRCRARTQLARCLRSLGDVSHALTLAEQAYRMGREADLPPQEVGPALLALISCEAEAGRLPDARAHSDELLEVVGDRADALGAEALWASATVRVRQGDYEGAQTLLGRALDRLTSTENLLLWVRLRLAAASLSLQSRPPLAERAAELLAEVEPAVSLVGTAVSRQELATLKAHLAHHQGRPDEARAIIRAMDGEPLLITHRDRIRLRILEAQLMIMDGEIGEGVERLRRLAEEAQSEANLDLAAEAWRLLAESLAGQRVES
ncbi:MULTISPECIES: helix-turn-helix domain-containing protein [Streptomyces]|uniref:Helix-turn-helix domain-containing protein n=1 Tax=Streptomyces chilikensis TaxID=1194079 RepID=A0ABV3ETX7_9ACTN|nr:MULTISPECIES: helix-turn-helix domain-containing protein [Streptomyces]MDH6226002.1 transcriptional regulator with XRE-family HTH domain [Streptomyces sp. MJP52]